MINENESSEDDEARGRGIMKDPIKACKLYTQKHGKCYRVKGTDDFDSVLLTPCASPVASTAGDGLWLSHGPHVYEGNGLLLGRNSPFQNIPVLGWLL